MRTYNLHVTRVLGESEKNGVGVIFKDKITTKDFAGQMESTSYRSKMHITSQEEFL